MKKYSILLILFFTFCSQTSSNETVEEFITPTTELIIEETKDIAKVESQPKFEGKQMVMIIQPI